MYNIAGYYTYLTETESWAGAAREGSHTSQKNTYTSMQNFFNKFGKKSNPLSFLYFNSYSSKN